MKMRLLLLQHDRPFAQRLAAELAAEPMVHCVVENLVSVCDAVADEDAFACEAVIVDWPGGRNDRLELLARCRARVRDVPLIVVADGLEDAELEQLVEAGVADVCLRAELDVEHVLLRVQLAVERTRVSVGLGSLTPQFELAPTGSTVPVLAGGREDGPLVECPSDALAGLLRVLHVVAVPIPDARCEQLLCRLGGDGAEVDTVCDYHAAAERFENELYDLVFIELDKPNIAALYAIESMRLQSASAVILMATALPDSRFAVVAVQRGADDYLDSAHLSGELVARLVRLARARRWRLCAADQCDAGMLAGVGLPSERRGTPRYVMTRSVLVVPVQPDFSPAPTLAADGFTRDVGTDGIGFELGGDSPLSSDLALLGVEDGWDGAYHFATIEITNRRQVAGHFQVGARFVSPDRELLRDENLLPTLCPDSLAFATGLPVAILNQWVELGLLRPVLIDRIYVCPRCRAIPTFRSGCHACGSIHVASHQLVHHFACAYVGMITEFQKGERFACPKCHATGLQRGTDYEQLHGPYHCLDCNWSDSVTELVADCLKCRWRFPLNQAAEEELIGYRANRLNPAQLLDCP